MAGIFFVGRSKTRKIDKPIGTFVIHYYWIFIKYIALWINYKYNEIPLFRYADFCNGL
jgi:hypothetical protein